MNFNYESVHSPTSKSETIQMQKNSNTPSFLEPSPYKSGEVNPTQVNQVSFKNNF